MFYHKNPRGIYLINDQKELQFEQKRDLIPVIYPIPLIMCEWIRHLPSIEGFFLYENVMQFVVL